MRRNTHWHCLVFTTGRLSFTLVELRRYTYDILFDVKVQVASCNHSPNLLSESLSSVFYAQNLWSRIIFVKHELGHPGTLEEAGSTLDEYVIKSKLPGCKHATQEGRK